jgi:hypothetical protein
MPSPQEEQARVYGVLDILTKPLQWFIGGLKVLGFLLLVAVVAIVTPVYHLVTTGTASSTEIEIALFVLGVVILFFAAPWYTVIGGIALLAMLFLYFAINPDTSAPSYEMVRNVLWGFQLVGFLWVGAKRSRRNQDYGTTDKGGEAHGSPMEEDSNARPRPHSAPKHNYSEVAKPDEVSDRYYRALGLENGATKEEIKQAHRDLAKVWHPDRFSEKDERLRKKAEEKFRQIREAYAYLNSHVATSPVSDVHSVDVNDAIQYVGAMMKIVKGDVEDFVRRFKAGEFAERADALQALERMIARVEEASANLNEVIERIRRDFPDAAANANFIQTQQNMNEVAECIRQMKERLGCQ